MILFPLLFFPCKPKKVESEKHFIICFRNEKKKSMFGKGVRKK